MLGLFCSQQTPAVGAVSGLFTANKRTLLLQKNQQQMHAICAENQQ